MWWYSVTCNSWVKPYNSRCVLQIAPFLSYGCSGGAMWFQWVLQIETKFTWLWRKVLFRGELEVVALGGSRASVRVGLKSRRTVNHLHLGFVFMPVCFFLCIHWFILSQRSYREIVIQMCKFCSCKTLKGIMSYLKSYRASHLYFQCEVLMSSY